VSERQRLVVHVVGQHREVVAHLLDRVRVVVGASVGALAQGVEHHPLRLGAGFDQVEDGLRGHSAPFRDAGAALDAEALGDLLVVGQGV
jgi:hypothetical protein